MHVKARYIQYIENDKLISVESIPICIKEVAIPQAAVSIKLIYPAVN